MEKTSLRKARDTCGTEHTKVGKDPNDLPRKASMAYISPVPQTDTGG